jgi:alcohol dehydrogenase (NADP+)
MGVNTNWRCGTSAQTCGAGSARRRCVPWRSGLAPIAVKFAAAVGADVKVLSRSPHREADARRLGVDRFLQTTDESR